MNDEVSLTLKREGYEDMPVKIKVGNKPVYTFDLQKK